MDLVIGRLDLSFDLCLSETLTSAERPKPDSAKRRTCFMTEAIYSMDIERPLIALAI